MNVKCYRGDVISVKWTDGNGGLKSRPVIVFQNANKNSDVISVYCTTQNNGDDDNNILVLADSDEGRLMGLDVDTYIRPNKIATVPAKWVNRIIGKTTLMQKINSIIDKRKSL